MKPIRRLLLLSTLASLLSVAAFAQQTPAAPATGSQPASPTGSQTTSTTPATDQSLPQSPDAQAHISPQPTGPTAIIDTSMGQMTCKLFSKEAPQTAANFVGLADGTKDWTDPATHQKMHGKPLYNGTTFHRVIPGFMIQGGDPLGTGEGDPGYYVPDELDPDLNFDVAGRLAMANSGSNTDGSQFFITTDPYPSLDQRYTIFGQCDPHSVIVAQSIAAVERDAHDKPLQPVTISKVTIVPPDQSTPQPVPPAPASPAPPQPQQ
jgi:peptidyl-prolyl cis-trans isomerase A (cyclophilin A)